MNRLLISAHDWLIAKSPRVKLLLCLSAGAVSGLALPPFDLWWVLALSVPAFLILLETKTLKGAFWSGWFFGFGYLLVVLHWIGAAFFVNAAADLWMMPFAVGGLCAFLALYWGLGALLSRFLSGQGLGVFWVAPPVFSVMEYLRGILFSGFPWGVPGLAVDGMGGLSQLSSLVGMNGLTFLLLMWAATPLLFYKRQAVLAGFILMILPLAWGWGAWRLAHNPTQFVTGVQLRIIQPNIPQDDAWRSAHAREIFDRLLALSAQPSVGPAVTHIIWPESIVPFLIDESPEGLAEVARMLGPEKILLTGAVRRSAPSRDATYFTSVLAIDGKAQVLGHYDKAHLVPGGEFLPLAWLLEPLGFRQVVPLPESFGAGAGPGALAIPGAGMVGAQVCYEAIFPGETIDPNHRPDWLVNVTNDGWFGRSTGPWQHVAQLRLRAIEQGLAVVRSANTGVSAVFDPFGRKLVFSNLEETGVYDFRLPQSLTTTLYARLGDFMLLLMMVAFAVLGLGVRFFRVFFVSNE
jgi:apolipoprotein N-acyltransferase